MKKSLQDIQNDTLEVTNQLILQLISLIDLTTLGNTDDNETVLNLIKTANKGIDTVFPAAVCTFANFGDFVFEHLNPQIKVAVVGGCFPTGQTLSDSKIDEVKLIAQCNVHEIDVVLNRGNLIANQHQDVLAEIIGMKKAAGNKHLKVILETGDLTPNQIKEAAEISIKGGADFIKTSTGKTTQGATPQAVLIMCQVIKTHFEKTGIKVGIKPSGGIRTLEDALTYYKIVNTILGKEWLTPSLFRIGASSLYTNLINSLKEQTND